MAPVVLQQFETVDDRAKCRVARVDVVPKPEFVHLCRRVVPGPMRGANRLPPGTYRLQREGTGSRPADKCR